jgi:general stress protein 26
MSDKSNEDKVWDIAKEIGVCMFITYDGERQRARPMAAYIHPDEHAFYFLTDEDSAKTWQIDKFPIVSLAFSAPAKNDYVAITGRAVVSNDRAKIRDIFNAFAKAWWDSAEDPAIRIVKVNPEDAELWESPNGPVATVKMLVAAATGGRPDMGDHAKVSL